MAELEQIRFAFAQDQELCNRVLAAAQQSRDQLRLSLDVIRYFTTQASSDGTTTAQPTSSNKKRKLSGSGANGALPSSINVHTPALLSVPDVSFSIPIRKKATLSIHSADGSTGSPGALLLITAKDATYSFTTAQIEHVFCVPVPEKTTKQHNFILLLSSPAHGEGAGAGAGGGAGGETQFVFTLPETAYTGTNMPSSAREGDTPVSLVGRTLNAHLPALPDGQQVSVQLPSEEEFSSAIAQPQHLHRKGGGGEPAASYHVKAHLGSKEGFLFFLRGGVLFGFKKPVLFFPFDRVLSTSYTSVLQRTFNLVVTVDKGPDANGNGNDNDNDNGNTRDVEFGMIDQADFAGIDRYVKGHGLNDASLAVERMAKRVGVNDPRRRKGGEGEVKDEPVPEDGESELQKAEREMQDAEDEEEDDYDPGSEGESEGEGSGSEDEDEDGTGGGSGEEVEDEDGEEEEEEEE